MKVYARRLDHSKHDHNVMAVYDPSHLSHFVKSQPVNDPTIGTSKNRKESNFASGLGRILKEDHDPIQTIFDDFKLSKSDNKENWFQKYSNDQSEFSSKEQEDQINRRFVTL